MWVTAQQPAGRFYKAPQSGNTESGDHYLKVYHYEWFHPLFKENINWVKLAVVCKTICIQSAECRYSSSWTVKLDLHSPQSTVAPNRWHNYTTFLSSNGCLSESQKTVTSNLSIYWKMWLFEAWKNLGNTFNPETKPSSWERRWSQRENYWCTTEYCCWGISLAHLYLIYYSWLYDSMTSWAELNKFSGATMVTETLKIHHYEKEPIYFALPLTDKVYRLW